MMCIIVLRVEFRCPKTYAGRQLVSPSSKCTHENDRIAAKAVLYEVKYKSLFS